MLQQILRDMYVEPELLEALSEEQKKTLFLKMREEQVRRWREREEAQDREAKKEVTPRAKKGSRKSVSWLLGRDGDVQVCVIGETEEENSPVRILSELRKNASVRIRTSSEQLITNQVDEKGIRLLLKKPEELGDSESTTAVTSGEQSQASDWPSLKSSLQDPKDDSDDSGTVEDDPKDHSEEENSGSASDDLSDSGIFYKPSFRGPGLSNTTSKPRPQDTQPFVNKRLSIKEKPLPQESQRQEKDVGKGSSSVCGSRVAQLRRNFGLAGGNSVPAGGKPPVPTKPAHLQRLSATMPR